jgi:excisionase family DNA binding protein
MSLGEGISRAFAYEAIQLNEVPHIRIGKRILLPKSQLQRLLSGDHELPEAQE